MLKNIIISAMAAVLVIEKVPWYAACTMEEKAGVFIGIFIPLLFFCFFCGEIAEKWRKYRERVRNIEQLIGRLRR